MKSNRLDSGRGVEVTADLGRSSVEIARALAGQTMEPGFIGLQVDAKQSEFDSVRSRGWITHSLTDVGKSIDRAITSPIGSSPNRGIEDLQAKIGSKASTLPFAQFFVMDDRAGKQIVQLK